MCKLVPFKDGHYVAGIKLRHINNISEQAKKCPNISRVMLFGSALEERCTKQSDIDIAVFGKQSKGKYLLSREYRDFRTHLFQFDFDQDYDILYFEDGKTYRDPIFNTIADGIELYRSA